jgi:serine/threonine-protein kinase HipA
VSEIERPISLIVRLNGYEVGTLLRTPDRTITFTFNPAYIEDEERPTLSFGFYDALGRLRTRRYSSNPQAPGFFANLVAEGHLRDYTAHRAGIARDDDFGLLWVTGDDLLGAVTLEDPEGRPLPPPSAGGPIDAPPLQDMFRFALTGVQIKFSAIRAATGGLTIRTHGDGGNRIVKLPSMHFEHVPEGEHAMLQFAREVGIPVPAMELVPLEQIGGLPDEVRTLTGRALVLDRFDRPAQGAKVHIEDFNQIFKQQPRQKYDNHPFADIAKTIYQALGNDGLITFIERLVFNIGIANNDMHLKNWSFIYPDGRHPQLAPAYDYVCTKAYLGHNETGLALGTARFFPQVSLEEFDRLANRAEVSTRVVRVAARDMVERMLERWPTARDRVPVPAIVEVIDEQLRTVPLFRPQVAVTGIAPAEPAPPIHEELS